jgi:hypothetical protein
MPTIQIWVNERKYRKLLRLQDFLESKIPPSKRRTYSRSRRRAGREKQIKRKINYSYIFNQAFDSYWNDKEEQVISFEEKRS